MNNNPSKTQQAITSAAGHPLQWTLGFPDKRPYKSIGEAKGPLQWMAAAEVMACWVLLGLLFIYPEKKWKSILSHPFLLFFYIL